MLKRNRFTTLIGLTGVVALMILWAPHQSGAAMVLKLNSPFAPGAPADIAANFFARNVKESTGGDIEIQVYPASQLGNDQASYQGMTLGTIDMFLTDSGLAGSIKGNEAFFVGQVPYLFNSLEDCVRIYNSEIYAPLYERLLKVNGIRKLVVAGHKQGRCINTTEGPIFSPEDCKGIKIRVMPYPICIKVFEAWGFKPTPVDWTQLYMALKQGIVDGQDNGPDLTCPQKFYEVAKYFAITNHVYSSYAWYISEKTWKKVAEKYHDVLIREAARAGDELTSENLQQWNQCINTMAEAGVKITIPNRAAFKEAAKDVYKEFEGKIWPEGMVEKIQAMQR
jgi:tripartite ATP-independent transporter DctP family solute receptor